MFLKFDTVLLCDAVGLHHDVDRGSFVTGVGSNVQRYRFNNYKSQQENKSPPSPSIQCRKNTTIHNTTTTTTSSRNLSTGNIRYAEEETSL